MKKTFIISFLLLILSNFYVSYGQVCAKFIEIYNGKIQEIPLIKVSFALNEQNKERFERSDVNGEIELEIPANLCLSEIYFETLNGLIVRLKNVPINPNKKLNLGQIIMPEFKYISIAEYNKLTRKQKRECIPDAHWTDIYGYLYSNELQYDYLILRCVKTNKKIKDFTFDSKSKIITLDWNTFKNCE